MNAFDYSGHSPLTKAAENGNYETVKILVDNNADIAQVENRSGFLGALDVQEVW